MAPAAVISGLIAVVNLGKSVGMSTFDDLMKNVQYQDHLNIFQKMYVPYITDDDLLNFIKTGKASFKSGPSANIIANAWNARIGSTGTYTTFDPNEALVMLADTPGMADRIETLAKNGYSPEGVNSNLPAGNDIQVWILTFWPYMLALLALLFLLFRKKRRKRK